MEPTLDALPSEGPKILRKVGFWGVLLGAIALMMVFAQIVGPTFEPKPYAATQIGEIAGEIKSSAWRSLMGLPQPEVEPEPASVWDYLAIVAPVLGIGALVLSLISGIMRENWRFSAYGATLGSAAIIFQFLWWMTLVILGVLLLVAIIENIGDIFSW